MEGTTANNENESERERNPQRFRTELGDIVIIGDFDLFESKKKRLIDGGVDKLQVVSDFDRTLTKPKINGKSGQTTYGVLSCGVLSEKFHRVEQELFDIYHPYEIDPLLSREKKFPLMEEWWAKATQNLIESDVTRRMIGDMVKSVGDALSFREGTSELLNALEDARIPTLILSAGLGDTIDFAFSQR
jgi:HAD superfamily hydrolase (TIGR01544 family)